MGKLAIFESKLLEDGCDQKRLKWVRENAKIEQEARLKDQTSKPVDDQPLQDYLIDSEYCTDGERLPRIIRAMSHIERQLWFADEALVSIRHTTIGVNTLVRRFSSL